MKGQKTLRLALLGGALTALAACQTGTMSTSNASSTPTAAATMAATSAATGTSVPAGSSTFVVANFDNTVATSDGFQERPTQDASFASLINGVRTTAGVAPLSYNAQLDSAAQAHADDMLANNFLGHTGSNGSTIEDRIRATGYVPTAWGENVAQGQQNENEALISWQNSAGHKANNESALFNEFGLARAGSGSAIRWALVFGAQ